MPTESEVALWASVVQTIVARDGVSEEEANARLVNLLQSSPVQADILADLGKRVSALEEKVGATS